MGRPAKEVQERRTETVAARFTMAEAATVEQQAAAAGVSVSEFLRSLALAGKVKPRKTKLEASLLVELNRIGVNINQIARYVNSGRQMDALLKTTMAELQKLMAKIDERL